MHLINVYINVDCIVKSANSYKCLLCVQPNHSLKWKYGVHEARVNQRRQVRTSGSDVRARKGEMCDRRPDGKTRLREWSRAAKIRGEWSRHTQRS